MALRASDIDFQRSYTVAEFEKLPQSYGRWELIEGKLVEKPVPKFEHSLIAEIIKDALKKFDPDKKLGMMLPEVSVYIRDDYSPAPDLSFWMSGRVPARNVATAPRPDLAVEIQSPDQSLPLLIKKAGEYIKGGVAVVWLIQPAKQSALIFRQGIGTPETIQPDGILSAEEVIPGFQLPIADLFV